MHRKTHDAARKKTWGAIRLGDRLKNEVVEEWLLEDFIEEALLLLT